MGRHLARTPSSRSPRREDVTGLPFPQSIRSTFRLVLAETREPLGRLLRRDPALETALRANGIVSPLIEGNSQDRR